ncbi:MAG: tetratricopeptide repeat protein [Lachnospiraceae bacterium]|nr:tetratricopeptide repeat protein [Lachnospiraceae bacterium]
MDIWSILGIKQTNKLEEIKRAYRSRLQTVNPEDDAEGFMELRAAYEQANKLAVSSCATETKEDVSKLQSQIAAVYMDFSSRISEEAWRMLLDIDDFVALDTSMDAFTELMRYLMEHYNLPRRIWKLLVEQFDIRERKKELSEQFPADFLDYMINNSIYEDVLSYDCFSGDETDYDTFIENYYRLDASIRKREYEEQLKYLKVLEELDVSHPYLDVARIRRELQLMRDEADEKKSELTDLFQDRLAAIEKSAQTLHAMYPEDITIIHICGDLALVQNKLDQAKCYYDKSYALAPDLYVVKGKQAELLYSMGEYAKSRDLFLELLRINHYDNNVRAGMIRANVGLLQNYQKQLDENPEDAHTRIEMAWCYYQNYHFKEAVDILEGVVPVGKQVFELHNVRGRSYLCMGEYDRAREDFFIWKDAILGIDDNDCSEEDSKLRKRLPYVHFLIADCYLKQREYDEARKYLDVALATEHDEMVLACEAKCELEYKTGDFSACLDACESLLMRDDRSYIAYMFQAKSDYQLEYYKDALTSCEHAIALYPYVAEPYCLEAHIYLKAGQTEVAKQMLDRFRAFGIPSDELDYLDACILELDDKHEEIVCLLEKTLERTDCETSDMEAFDDIYMMLGFHLEKLDRLEKAIEMYEKALELDKNQLIANGRLGYIYKKQGNFNQALLSFERQLEIKKHPAYLIEQGILLEYFGEERKAFESYKETLAYDENNRFCLVRMGLILESSNKFQDAMNCFERAYKHTESRYEEERKSLLVYMARVLQITKQFDRSLRLYNQYMELYGSDADVVYDYTELLVRCGRGEEAIDILMAFFKKNNLQDEQVHACIRQFVGICGQEGKIKPVQELFDWLTKEGVTLSSKTYAAIGRAYFVNECYQEAVYFLEKAVTLDKDSKENYYSDLVEAVANKIHFRLKKMPDLLKHAQETYVDRKLSMPMDFIRLSRLLRCMGNLEKAMKVSDKALHVKRCSGCFYSRCHEALYEKALIYERKRDYDMAKMCLQEAIRLCGHHAVYEKRLKRINKK